MFRNILIPVDFTPKNKRAVAAALQAGGPRARITLLHIVEEIRLPTNRELKKFYAELLTDARIRMKKLGHAIRRRPVREEIYLGHRTEGIVRTARARKVDLIVMNSHAVTPGRKGQDWGTISYKVAILAPCPILLVK
ncbi:MAG TPA: universal stress protein [bacterium]|nr:universal stress protein [bacterium]